MGQRKIWDDPVWGRAIGLALTAGGIAGSQFTPGGSSPWDILWGCLIFGGLGLFIRIHLRPPLEWDFDNCVRLMRGEDGASNIYFYALGRNRTGELLKDVQAYLSSPTARSAIGPSQLIRGLDAADREISDVPARAPVKICMLFSATQDEITTPLSLADFKQHWPAFTLLVVDAKAKEHRPYKWSFSKRQVAGMVRAFEAGAPV